jgi:translocation and assembly module TamB
MTYAAKKLVYKCIGAVLVLIALTVSWLLFTASGSSTSLQVLKNRFSEIEYEYKSGTLASGLHLGDVRWTLKNKTIVSAPNVEFHWNPKCWHAKKLCISDLKADQLVIDVAGGGATSEVKQLAPVNLPVAIQADHLQIGEIVVNNPGASPLIFSNVVFNGHIQGTRLLAEKLQLDWLWLQANVSGSMTLQENYPVNVSGTLISTDPGLTLPVNSNWQVGGDLLSLQLDADFVAPYAGKLTGSYSLLRTGLPADIKISWPTAPWPRQSDDQIVFVDKGEIAINGTGPDYKTQGSATVHGHTIPPANVTIEGKINSRKATFFPMQFDTLGGTLTAEGVFKWHNGLSWNMSLNADELWPDLYWPKLKGIIGGTAHFSGRAHNSQTRLELSTLNLDGTMHGHRFRVTGDASKDPFGVWHLSAMEATNNDNQLYANGSIGTESELKLVFHSQSIHKFVNNIYGDAHGDLTISGDLRSPDIAGSVTSANLKFGDTIVRNMKSKGVIRAGGTEQSAITTAAESVSANSQIFRNAKLELTGNIAEHLIGATFEHDLGRINNLRIKGTMDKSPDWQGRVLSARGSVLEHPVALSKSFDARWINEKKSVLIEPHCWNLNLARSCVTKTAVIGQNGKVLFTINALDLDNIRPAQTKTVSISGLLNSQGALNWGYDKSPSVKISGAIDNPVATLKDTADREKVSFALDNVKINVATQANQIKTNVKASARQLGAIDVQVDIDTDSPEYPLNGSLAMSSNNINWLRSYLPDASVLKGQLSADGFISGNLAAPLINGVINFSNGAFASPLLPIDLDDIAMDIEFSNRESRITGTANSGATAISLNGSGAQGENGWNSTINVKADQLKVDTDLFRRARVSPDLNILVSESGVRIDGAVNIHRADIVVNDLAAGGVATSSDVVIVDASNKEPRQKVATKQHIISELDVSLGPRVKFSGYGLKADLSGDFHLALDTRRPPELLGEIMVDRGTYRSYGQNLIIRDGRITFVGPLEQTAVTVEAVREVDNVLAGLRVDGSLKNPTTTLFSEPSMPQEEILSYVVLGRSLEFGSTDDSQMLTNAALFMGISNGRSFSQNIAENLGIEDFYLTATGTGDETQVMLSGRLNNRLLVRYGVGVFNAVSTLFLRYDLAEQLYIETTQGLEKAIDIFYSFEF